MIEQIKASDQWAYYQAKGIKSSLLTAQMEILSELGKQPKEADTVKAEKYKTDQEEISKEAKEKEEASAKHLAKHQVFAESVTFLQVAIAVSAISVLIKRRRFWYLSLGFGFAGLAFFIQALLMK